MLLAALASATPERIAALERKLASSPAAERPSILLDLAEVAEATDLDRALAAAREAQQLAPAPAQKLTAQLAIAAMLRQRTNYQEALQLARYDANRR